jgi:hypothetical protein
MTDEFAAPDRFRGDLRDALLDHAAALREDGATASRPASRPAPRPAGRARGHGRSLRLVARRLAPAVAVAAVVVAAVLAFRSGGTLHPKPATAAEVLNASATALERQGGSRALGPSDFFYSRIAVWWRYAQFARHPYVVRSVDEEWRARDGRGRSRYHVIGLSGTGASSRLPLARSQDTQLRRVLSHPFILSSAPEILVSYAQLRRLPTDPARLGDALDRIISRYHVARRFPEQDIRTAIRFEILRELAALPTAASLRASLYRVLATTPGIHLLGHTRDSIGRSGTAVAVNIEDVQLELILDPTTGELLQTSRTLLHRSKAYYDGKQPPGLINRATYLASGVVTSTRARVG